MPSRGAAGNRWRVSDCRQPFATGGVGAAVYTDESEEEELDEQLSVYRPVVASNEGTVDALNNHEDYDFDVALLENTVNLNDVVEPNDTGEHTVTFKFYRGSADWQSEENQGEVTVTGCDTAGGDGLIGSIVGSVDVFGSLEGISGVLADT